MLTLYDFTWSANCYRVRLLLSLLGLPYETVAVNLATGQQLRPAYRAISPLGQVPVLRDGELLVRDSHAIGLYLCERERAETLWPADPAERAAVLQWIFLDANELHNGIGLARNHYAFGVGPDGAFAKGRGEAALAVLDARLTGRDWLELDRPTLADITCYPLVSRAGEATIDLAAYPAIEGWMRRIEALADYVPMVAA